MKLDTELQCVRQSHYRLAAGVLAAWAACGIASPLRGQSPAASAGFQSVELPAPGTNAGSDGTASSVWAALPRGAQSFGGVPFKIDSTLEITGMEAARRGEFHPPRLAAIPIGRRAARLHLLHGANGAEKDGVPLAKFMVHYANGEQRAVRLAYGVHARSWRPERREPRDGLLDPDSRLAWTGAGDDAERGSVALRLFQTAIPNPLPDQEIARVEWVSLFSRATPFLAALTLETQSGETMTPSSGSPRRVVKKSLELGDSVYHDELIIRATDAGTGHALTNASAALTVSDDEAAFYFGEARADGTGVIRLPYPPQHTVAFHALVRAPGRMPLEVIGARTNSGGFPREAEAKLARGVRIGGVVTDVKGKAIPGAEVTIYQVTQTGPREYTRFDYEVVRTADDGQWSSESVPAGFEGFSFEVTHPEFRSLIFTQAVTTSAGAPAVSRDDLLAGRAVTTLPAAFRVEGVVADESGQPVKDAELRLVDASRPEAARPLALDAQGRFSFLARQPEEVSLMAQAKGFRAKIHSVDVDADLKPLTITLAKAQPFRGRVYDQNREPVAGARVKLDSWNGLRLLQWQTLTDPSGAFAWDAPPEGNVMLQITATNHSSMRTSVGQPSGEQSFNLRKMSRVFGRVVDAETKQPVDDFTVVPGRSYGPDQPIRWERYNSEAGRKGEFSVRLNEYSSSGSRMQVMVDAPGYVPVASPVFTKAGIYTNDFELRKGRGLAGVVQGADGRAVSNATVLLVERSESAYMEKAGELARNSSYGSFQRSNTKGQFEFPPKLEPHTILAAHASGYAEVAATHVAATGRVELQPWGRVRGVLRVGRRVEPGQSVLLESASWRSTRDGRSSPPLSLSMRVEPDADGNFVVEKIPPGERKAFLYFKLNERERARHAYSHGTSFTVKPGETAEVVIGGGGRTVTGRMTILGGGPEDVDWQRDQHTLESVAEMPTNLVPPVISENMPDDERRKAWQEYNQKEAAFWRTPEGMAQERKQRNYVLRFETNGVFRVDNVEPGRYRLYVALTNPDRPDNYYEHIGSLNKEVTVPPAPADKPDEPFDLGLSEVSVRGTQRAGRPAPKFEVKTFDGKTVKLADFTGKFVLLDFWATWAGARNLDLQMLKALHSAYGKDTRIVMLGLNFDPEPAAAKKAIEENGLQWLQAYGGPWSETRLPAAYGVQGLPANVLIDPEGKIAASNLRGSAIRTTIRNRLGDPQGASAKP